MSAGTISMTIPMNAIGIVVLLLLAPTISYVQGEANDGVDWDIAIPIHLEFDPERLSFGTTDGLVWLAAEGFDTPFEEGAPFVPVRTIRVLIPASTVEYELRIERMELESRNVGSISSVPVQVPIGSDAVRARSSTWTTPIDHHLRTTYEGVARGYRMLELLFAPVIPTDVSIEIATTLDASILVRMDGSRSLSGSSDQDHIEGAIYNMGDIASFGRSSYVPTGRLPNGTFDYVVITDPSKVQNAFEGLVGWKTQKGVTATIFTVSQIYANYTGKDNQERIRNFVKDAVATWGTDYILLGGDTSVVPYRGLYCAVGEDVQYDIAADFYYSALDGTFNADNDTVWGETTDQVDLFYDVVVGRAPVQTSAEALNFVDRVLNYERSPPEGYLDRVLFAGEYLDGITNSSCGLDLIKATLPDGSAPVSLYDKSYGSAGTLSKASFIANINQGVNYAYHSGHSSETTMSVGSPGGGNYDLYNGDMTRYNGSYRIGVLNSIGCITTRFNYEDCIAEEHVKRTSGGSVAYIGNSRYGWYAYGYPGMGTSDVFQASMADQLYGQGISGLGAHFAEGKDRYAAYATGGTARWVLYCLNLIGDPESDVWTSEPSPLNVSFPEWIGMDCTEYEVVVSNSTGAPVKDALVCLDQEGGYYDAIRTNASGSALFHPTIDSSIKVRMTVTAWNHRPFERNVSVDLFAPMIAMNMTDQPTTGDPFELRFRIWDDFEVKEARATYRQGPDPNDTSTVALIGNGTDFTATVLVQAGTLADLSYMVSVSDVSGNKNSTIWSNLTVVDDDGPIVRPIPSRDPPSTGDIYRMEAEVADNIGVDKVTIDVFSGETNDIQNASRFHTARMQMNGSGHWEDEFMVPSDALGNISIVIEAFDGSGNKVGSLSGPFAIRDNDPVVFGDDRSDPEGTTGDVLHFRVAAMDNRGVREVLAKWRPASTTLVVSLPLALNGSYYEGSFSIPSSFDDDIRYRFAGMDLSGNWFETKEKDLPVRDDDPPYIMEDATPRQAATGDIITISVKAGDNLEVEEAVLSVLQGPTSLADKASMDRGPNGAFSKTLTVPSGSTDQIRYNIVLKDGTGNTFEYDDGAISVGDDDPPWVLNDLSDGSVQAGARANFSIEVGDNVGVASVTLEWWMSGSDDRTIIDLVEVHGRWAGSAAVDENATGMLLYVFHVEDTSGNVLDGTRRSIKVIPMPKVEDPEDDPPLPGEDSDADGMEDLWEHRHNLTIGINDSALDADNDTWSNVDEFRAGTDPNDPMDHPFERTTPGEGGRDYVLLFALLVLLGAVIVFLLVFLILRKRNADEFSVEMD